MALGHVQSTGVDGAATKAFAAAVTAGNTLICAVRAGASGLTGWSVSDTVNGSTWTSLAVQSDGSNTLMIAYKANTAAGTPTVTATWTGGGSTRLIIAEYGGVLTASPVDQYATRTQVTNNPFTPSVTTTSANEVLLAIAEANNGPTWTDNAAGSVPSSGWVNRQNIGGGKIVLSDVVVSATGTYNETWTASDNAFATAILTLIGSGAGPPPAAKAGTLPLMMAG